MSENAAPRDSRAGLLKIALGPHGNHVGSLVAITKLRERLDEEEQDLAATMRLSGSTWQEIGNLWGITRQAAQQRFNTASVPDKLDSLLGRPTKP